VAFHLVPKCKRRIDALLNFNKPLMLLNVIQFVCGKVVSFATIILGLDSVGDSMRQGQTEDTNLDMLVVSRIK
jgi:hypothetical protein